MPGKAMIELLTEKKGHTLLRAMLVEQFFALGQRGIPLAMANWRQHKLDYARRKAMGLCLQKLLAWIDSIVVEHQYHHADGEFCIGNQRCEVRVRKPAKHIYHLEV